MTNRSGRGSFSERRGRESISCIIMCVCVQGYHFIHNVSFPHNHQNFSNEWRPNSKFPPHGLCKSAGTLYASDGKWPYVPQPLRERNFLQPLFSCIAGSPRRVALDANLYAPTSYFAYALILAGLAIFARSPEHRFSGAILSAGAASLNFGYRCLLSNAFVEYCTRCLDEDLADIASHYHLEPVHPDGADSLSIGPSGFWVVERDLPDKRGQEIIGCVGLGICFIFWICSVR